MDKLLSNIDQLWRVLYAYELAYKVSEQLDKSNQLFN